MSSREHRRYVMVQKSKEDKLQSRLTVNGENVKLVKPPKEIIEESSKEKINIDKVVYCPFCLYKDKLLKFLIKDSKGEISRYKVQCPECRNIMLLKTLNSMHCMTKNKVKAYAKWVCQYRQGFWRKVNRPVWEKRLKQYSFSGIFWSEYKKLKASLPREHINEME